MVGAKNRFSVFVETMLKQEGWFQGRNVSNLVIEWNKQLTNSDKFVMFPEAQKVLLEFGGIHVNQNGAGESCARESFTINPALAIGESDRFEIFAKQLKTPLYPLGEASGGHYFLVIGEDKRVFLIMNDARLLGNTFEEALENLIKGINAPSLNVYW